MADADIKAMASEAFAGHVLEDKGNGRWRCGAPSGTSVYSFNVYFAPGVVCFWGDVGELILCHSDKDSLKWLLSSPSMDYVLGKTRATDGDKKEFSWVQAMADISNEIKEARAELQESRSVGEARTRMAKRVRAYEAIRNDLREVEHEHWKEQQRVWYHAWADHAESGASDVAPCEEWSPGLQWQWYALAAFVRLYKARPTPERDCTCVDRCKGAAGLAPGYRCVSPPRENV